MPSAVKGIVLSDEFTAEQRHDMNKLARARMHMHTAWHAACHVPRHMPRRATPPHAQLLSEAKLERKVEKQEGRDLVSILAGIDA